MEFIKEHPLIQDLIMKKRIKTYLKKKKEKIKNGKSRLSNTKSSRI